MKNLIIWALVILGGIYFYGKTRSSDAIENMYRVCAQNAGIKQAYCKCKFSVMKQEVSPIGFVLDGRKEGKRIIAASTRKCTSKLF